MQDQDLSTCDHYDGINGSNSREKLRSAAVDYTTTKKTALDENDESNSDDDSDEDENDCTSIKSIVVALTLARDLQ